MTHEQRLGLGAAVLAARGSGLRWKVLERLHGRSRAQLWRYAQAALEVVQAGQEKSLCNTFGFAEGSPHVQI